LGDAFGEAEQLAFDLEAEAFAGACEAEAEEGSSQVEAEASGRNSPRSEGLFSPNAIGSLVA